MAKEGESEGGETFHDTEQSGRAARCQTAHDFAE